MRSVASAFGLSQNAKPEVPRDALKRILASDAARLAENVGDGPWLYNFQVPFNSVEAVAGLLWARLGSPDTVERWHAAHAVRQAARLGCWKIVDALVDWFDKEDANAFQDRKLPFFKMHAQLWLLTALARIALDYPAEIARYSPLFMRVMGETDLPHPAMQDAAKRAYIASLKGKKPTGTVVALLDSINRSTPPFNH